MALSEATKKAVVLLLDRESQNPSGRWPCVLRAVGIANGEERSYENQVGLCEENDCCVHDWTDYV